MTYGLGLVAKMLAGGLQTLTQQFSVTASASSVSVSGQVQSGDLIVHMNVARNFTGAPNNVTPTGFTHITDFLQDARMSLNYKISNGSETTIFGMVGGVENYTLVYTFRGDVPILSVAAQDVTTEGNTADPAAQTQNAGSGVAPLVIFGCYRATTAVDPRTFTVGGSAAKDGEISPSTLVYLAYKIYNSSPQDAVIDMDDEGNNMLASFFLECTG